jgi:hypothetical protein
MIDFPWLETHRPQGQSLALDGRFATENERHLMDDILTKGVWQFGYFWL